MARRRYSLATAQMRCPNHLTPRVAVVVCMSVVDADVAVSVRVSERSGQLMRPDERRTRPGRARARASRARASRPGEPRARTARTQSHGGATAVRQYYCQYSPEVTLFDARRRCE